MQDQDEDDKEEDEEGIEVNNEEGELRLGGR